MKRGGLHKGSSDDQRASLAACFSGWSDEVLDLIWACDDRMTSRGLYALPPGHRWQHWEGITLLGDAAHLMSPFGGDGANLAMRDAADLALALAAGDDWRAAVRGFEVTMQARAEEHVAGARDGLEAVFGEDSVSHVLQMLQAQSSLSAA